MNWLSHCERVVVAKEMERILFGKTSDLGI
jgi:hypothetical protein